MDTSISQRLFRGLGTHALQELSITEGQLNLVVAPWADRKKCARAEFTQVDILYIEAERDGQDAFLDFNLPWDIIRFDSKQANHSAQKTLFEFGLCCRDVKIGFVALWPNIVFDPE